MTIIKEFCLYSRQCIIRTDTYAHSLRHFQNLFEIAKKDYPDLKPENVEVIHYAGERYARTFGIEFKPTDETRLSDYDYAEIALHEYIY